MVSNTPINNTLAVFLPSVLNEKVTKTVKISVDDKSYAMGGRLSKDGTHPVSQKNLSFVYQVSPMETMVVYDCDIKLKDGQPYIQCILQNGEVMESVLGVAFGDSKCRVSYITVTDEDGNLLPWLDAMHCDNINITMHFTSSDFRPYYLANNTDDDVVVISPEDGKKTTIKAHSITYYYNQYFGNYEFIDEAGIKHKASG